MLYGILILSAMICLFIWGFASLNKINREREEKFKNIMSKYEQEEN